uniref:Uncharacterized protein n=1 Tax=Arundo donax TaxID=35708 RepID=A0A0A8YSV2_ARUDO
MAPVSQCLHQATMNPLQTTVLHKHFCLYSVLFL